MITTYYYGGMLFMGTLANEPFAYLEIINMAQERDLHQAESMQASVDEMQEIKARMLSLKVLLQGFGDVANEAEENGHASIRHLENNIADFEEHWERLLEVHQGTVVADLHPFNIPTSDPNNPFRMIALDNASADDIHRAINCFRDLLSMEGYEIQDATQRTKFKSDQIFVEGTVYEAMGRHNPNKKTVENQRTG